MRYSHRVALGPGFSRGDLISIALFVANYAFVAPVSAVCVAIGIALRRKRRPLWLIPIAGVNLIVAVPQLALFGADAEGWLTALLVLQTLAALAVLAWLLPRNPRRS